MPRAIGISLQVLGFAPNAPTNAELLIYGEIGDFWDDRSVAAADVARRLSELPSTVTQIDVRINSVGGSVADGLAIYNRLKEHPARVRVFIDGVAASIASVIAMAGDEIIMPHTALMMIHSPRAALFGNAADLREFADALDLHASAMGSAYCRKSGRSEREIGALLSDGVDHWYTADQAIAAGFADTLSEGTDEPVARGSSNFAKAIWGRAPAHIVAALHPHEITGENRMPAPTQPQPTPSAATPAAPALDAVAALNQRNAQLRGIFAQFRHTQGAAALEADCLADASLTLEAVQARVLAHLGAAGQPLNGGGYRVEGGGAVGSSADFIAGASDALLARAGIRIAEPHAAARDFQHTSILEMARASLSRGRGDRGFGGDSPESVIRAAMQTTSDFPLILENALNKAIRAGMESPDVTHRSWCRVTQARDFKPQSRVLLGSAPNLEQVLEMGEYTHGYLTEDRASLVPGKFGRIIALSWESLVNDDVGAFLSIGPGMGLAAMRAEADTLYTLITKASLAGVTMQDNFALFATEHNNALSFNTGTGKPLTAIALSAARAKLRRQTGVGGALLNLAPRTLLVPPERESEAEILVAASTVHTGQAASQADGGWLRKLQVIAEPRFANTDTVYLVADSSMIDCGEVSVLTGSPTLIEEDGFKTDCRRWKVRHTFAAGILDHRGIVKLTLTAA